MKKAKIFVLLCGLFFSSLAHADEFSSKGIYIEVYYDIFTMRVWEVGSQGDLALVGNYPVTLTWKKYKLPKKAHVTDIIFNPIWYPTEGVKARYLKKHGRHLKKAYAATERQNAMGAFKWKLHFVKQNGFYTGDNSTRVHEEKVPDKIGTKDSSGCVRLLKEDGLYLSHLLKQYSERIIVYTTSDKALLYSAM